MNSSEPVGTVRALWRFPVKSMLGEQLEAAEVTEGGLLGDRRHALVDRETICALIRHTLHSREVQLGPEPGVQVRELSFPATVEAR